MTISSILGALIIGAIIGALGRLVVPGKQDIPLWLTVVVGIVAALIGSAIVRSQTSNNFIEIIVQVVLAAVGVYAVSAMRSGRGARAKL